MTKFSLFALLCLFFLSAACAETSAINIHAAVDAQLRTNEQRHGIPGQAVLVLHNSDILYRNASGMTAIENGNVGFFAAGWDYGKSGRWHEVGHDGGTKVRVRILFAENLDDHYVVVYLTNGNKDGVWSRTLVDSVQTLLLPK